MNGPDEKVQIAQVISRLEEKFPTLPADNVEKVVAEQVAELDGNPIRDYVPRLVEHAAKDKLRATAAP